MTMWAQQLPRTAGAGLILGIATAALITFAATIALVHAEIYFGDPLATLGPMTGGF
jgi:hypothetical protein